MHIQVFSSLWKDYYLLCAILLVSLHEFCSIFQRSYYAWNHKMIYPCTNRDDDAQMSEILQNSYLGVDPLTFVEQPFHFLVKHYTWNVCLHATHGSNEVCCSKNERRMTNQASELLLYTVINWALYCFNTAFTNPHSSKKNYPLLSIIVLLTLHDSRKNFNDHITLGSIKWSNRAQIQKK